MKNSIKAILSWAENNIPKILIILTVVISLGSFVYYFKTGQITAYGDSKGHLNIARRVIDSPTPGIAQLGGYWLPLLHLLMIPTIWNDYFWNTGISGSIPNIIAFIFAVYFTYKFSEDLTKSKLSGLLAASVLLFNPNLLFMQSAPMTESLFIATTVSGSYYLYRYVRDSKISDGILAGILVSLSSLNRYEGWGLVIGSSALLIYGWIISKFNRKREGQIFFYSTLALTGILSWLIWGAVIFKDPLEFMHNTLSAGKQTQTQFTDVSVITGYHDAGMAALTNIYAFIHTSGYFVTSLVIIGFILFCIRNIKSIYKVEFLSILVLSIPLLFDILTVFIGNVPVEVPEFSRALHSGYFNVRYSLYSLPLAAILISYIFKNKYFKILLFVIILFSYWNISELSGKKLAVLQDIGTNRTIGYFDKVNWFKANYNYDGYVLTSTGSDDTFMQDSGIHLKNFISEGSYKLWDESLENPSKYAKWVLISENNSRDEVNNKVNKQRLFDQFEVVYQFDNNMILKKK